MSRKFVYISQIKWIGEKKVVLCSQDKTSIEIGPPLEFRGYKNRWSPEELFVSAVNSCIMLTFLYYADKYKYDIVEYQSAAEGILEKVEGQFRISVIKVRPKISFSKNINISSIEEIMKLCEKNCYISNSVNSQIEIIPEYNPV